MSAALSQPNRLALFDCDGTLVDSQANICRAMIEAFEGNGLAAPDDRLVRRAVGLSLVEAMRALLPESDPALHSKLGEDYKKAFRDMRRRGVVDEPLFAGIADCLIALNADGWMLGVATGKSDRGLLHCLEHHGLRHLFVTLQTADRHPSKPHPSMIRQAMADAGSASATTVMIGDTSFDIGMGLAANCATVGVAWGYHEAEELFAEGADFVADRPDQLPEILASALRPTA